ncbi:sialate O-acetylesterase [Terriglobus saanensis]|uniref:Sialate O-acetylesterase n=1 Tax=Terriglobus saanensis (strain ATCC BAA-1853 / DSM 23119 / SP1PR4) TaxID=401053 RepID=E8V0Q2_TERSS|nr:sialate O-acetylesterase [Terriglobus saanensis]ADV81115.1 Sialate O-acetylesterase [Terriglobus saanensis SP1PR4]
MRSSRYLIALVLSSAALTYAEPRLPSVLSDHAVLQRDRPVRIWGWATPQEKITVKFHDQTRTANADALGEWQVFLLPEHAGGPFTLSVTSDQSGTPIERKDILLGDVWIASGQSNMEMPLKGFGSGTPIKDSEKEIAAANHPRIRLLLQKKATSTVPLTDSADTWTECTPDTAANFSAVAYFFGREISEKENVPIGLIDTTWGGTPAHAWISLEGIAAANLTSVANDAAVIARDQGIADRLRADYARQADAAKAAGQPVPAHPPIPNDHAGSWTPGTLYNAMIAPYIRYTIKGAIWYQGETDTAPARAPYYSRVFSTLIKDWRAQWAQGDFPFFYVQISSYTADNDGWGRVRDAQRRTLALVNTGQAVTLDVGLEKNIHPPDKQTVGARLAANALATVYGKKMEYSSPEFLQATTEPGAMRVWFTHGEGLTTKGQALGGFEVAGDDHKFVSVTATLEKVAGTETIVLTAPSIAMPKYARYAWTGFVTSFVYNAAGFPLGTFTSESM